MEIPFKEAIVGLDQDKWKNAIYSEIKSLIENNTLEIVEKPVEAKVLGCRTVLRNKYGPDGSLERRKARVVAQGFAQRPNIDFADTFAPVARLSSFRMLIALSVEYIMRIEQLDVTSAFLYGEIDTEIYMKQPELLNEMLQRITREEKDALLVEKARITLTDLSGNNKVCKLKKGLYGLRQAGRQWNAKLHSVLTNTRTAIH